MAWIGVKSSFDSQLALVPNRVSRVIAQAENESFCNISCHHFQLLIDGIYGRREARSSNDMACIV